MRLNRRPAIAANYEWLEDVEQSVVVGMVGVRGMDSQGDEFVIDVVVDNRTVLGRRDAVLANQID